MSSTKKPFTKQMKCPVVGHQVSLKGLRVTVAEATEIAQRSCSNVVHCLNAHGSIESITGCLLHELHE